LIVGRLGSANAFLSHWPAGSERLLELEPEVSPNLVRSPGPRARRRSKFRTTPGAGRRCRAQIWNDCLPGTNESWNAFQFEPQKSFQIWNDVLPRTNRTSGSSPRSRSKCGPTSVRDPYAVPMLGRHLAPGKKSSQIWNDFLPVTNETSQNWIDILAPGWRSFHIWFFSGSRRKSSRARSRSNFGDDFLSSIDGKKTSDDPSDTPLEWLVLVLSPLT